MKKLRVTVNGQTYDVQVEILEDDEIRHPSTLPAGYAAASQSPIPSTTPGAPSRPLPPPALARESPGETTLLAPIIGVVTQILIEPGDCVLEKQPVIVLDAMKMDTYVSSPGRATVSAIHCRIGEMVQVGQKLVTFSH